MVTNLENISSFCPPAWCKNGNIHTIGRSLSSYPSLLSACKTIEISTPDDDFLELDVVTAATGRPVVILFHGLEGSSRRYYIVELMNQFYKRDFSVVAVNFRGCGSRLNKRRRFYHSGETSDMHTVFTWMKDTFPNAAIAGVGFSLGGNALLKSLGELNAKHPLDTAAAVSVPYNLALGSRHIHQGFNRIYEYNFLYTLIAKLRKKRAVFPDLPTFTGSSLFTFDDQVTAPIHGFKDATDYYSRCSSNQFIPDIETPTLLIHSKADPICSAKDIPLAAIRQNKKLDYIITEEGGHVGFWSKPPGWLNKIIVNYIQQKID